MITMFILKVYRLMANVHDWKGAIHFEKGSLEFPYAHHSSELLHGDGQLDGSDRAAPPVHE